MTSSRPKSYLVTLILLLTTLPLIASTTNTGRSSSTRSTPVIWTADSDEAVSVLQSLRASVAQNPGDYVSFETAVAANQFIAEHADATRETDRTMVQRGILGYFRGKAIALVPSLAIYSHLAASH